MLHGWLYESKRLQWSAHVRSSRNIRSTGAPYLCVEKVYQVTKPTEKENAPLIPPHAMTIQLPVDEVSFLFVEGESFHLRVVQEAASLGGLAVDEVSIVDGEVFMVGHGLRDELVGGRGGGRRGRGQEA